MQLERLVRLRGAALEKRDRDVVRAGRHERARAQASVDLVGGGGHVGVGQRVVRFAAHLREEHALTVDGDLELVRPLEAGHVADDVAQQEHVEFVLAVEREVVADLDAAARAERQPFDVRGLREIGWRAIHGRHGRCVGIADRKRSDLGRRREVLLEQRRRRSQDVRNVVEPVGLVVGRQELGGVDLEREQVAHGVAVLRAVQPMQRRLTGLRRGQGGLVQAALEVRDEAVCRLGIGARAARRRHLPSAQLARHVLEHGRVGRNVVEVDVLERQAGLSPRRVVAFETVAADDSLVARGELLVGGLAAGDEQRAAERNR